MYPQPPHPHQHAQPLSYPGQRPVSTKGAKILTFSGIGVLVIGVIALVAAIMMLFSIVPSGLLTSSGAPGSETIANTDVPGSTSITSQGNTAYTVWAVSDEGGRFSTTRKDVEVRGPDGQVVALRTPSVSASSSVNSFRTEAFGEFQATAAGTYEITVSAATTTNAEERVFVTEAMQFGSFITGLFGTVGLMFLGIGGLIVGFGIALGGTIWWITANNKKKRQATSVPGYAGQPGHSA